MAGTVGVPPGVVGTVAIVVVPRMILFAVTPTLSFPAVHCRLTDVPDVAVAFSAVLFGVLFVRRLPVAGVRGVRSGS